MSDFCARLPAWTLLIEEDAYANIIIYRDHQTAHLRGGVRLLLYEHRPWAEVSLLFQRRAWRGRFGTRARANPVVVDRAPPAAKEAAFWVEVGAEIGTNGY